MIRWRDMSRRMRATTAMVVAAGLIVGVWMGIKVLTWLGDHGHLQLEEDDEDWI